MNLDDTVLAIGCLVVLGLGVLVLLLLCQGRLFDATLVTAISLNIAISIKILWGNTL